MSGAFVLITTKSGTEALVLDQLKSIAGIQQASIVFGLYDILVRIADQNLDMIKDIILNEIRNIPDIRSTSTLFLLE